MYGGICAKGYPVPESLYSEMRQRNIWDGGWVITEQEVVKYVSHTGLEYDETLGDSINPCPMAIYTEMLLNGIWEGGWIEDSTGAVHYVQSSQLILGSGCGCGNSGCNSGCGMGSGCGCGCGCGCGSLEALGCSIKKGSIEGGYVTYNGSNVGKIKLSWTAGKTIGQNGLSEVMLSIKVLNLSYTFNTSGTYAVWVNAYEMAIHGVVVYKKNNEPSGSINVDMEYIIPEEYREYV